MLLLLLAAKLAFPGRERADVPGFDKANPYRFDLSQVAGSPPELLVVGDSRMGRISFGDFARGYGAQAQKGLVWSVGSGSLPPMLEHLASLGVQPPVLVLGASPLSMGLGHFERNYRTGLDPDMAQKDKARLWEAWLRHRVLDPVTFLPDESGPELVTRRLQERRKTLLPDLPDDPQAERRSRPVSVSNYRFYFKREPKPDAGTVEATIRALRACRARGQRVVMVRLPVSEEILGMEDAWGARAMLRHIAEAAQVPLVDLNDLPEGASLRAAIFDGSHVSGEEARRALSELAGAKAREALP